MVDHHEDELPLGEAHLKKLLGQYGQQFVRRLLDLMEADMSAKAPGIFQRRLPDVEESRRRVREILARGDCLTLKDMALDGGDLQAMGIPPGPRMGALLNRLLEAVWAGQVENDKEALKQFVLRLEGRRSL